MGRAIARSMVRWAGREDERAVLALLGRVVAHMNAHGLTHWDASYPGPDVVRADLDAGTLCIRSDGDGPIAMATLDRRAPPEYAGVTWRVPLDRSLYVHRLGVDPAYVRRGIAREMMGHAERVARELGLGAVKLDAYAENPGASGLYPALGYVCTGHVRYPPHPAPFLTFEHVL